MKPEFTLLFLQEPTIWPFPELVESNLHSRNHFCWGWYFRKIGTQARTCCQKSNAFIQQDWSTVCAKLLGFECVIFNTFFFVCKRTSFHLCVKFRYVTLTNIRASTMLKRQMTSHKLLCLTLPPVTSESIETIFRKFSVVLENTRHDYFLIYYNQYA
jgi:hypothetical protein